MTVALSTELDDELRLEARVLDLIHRVNTMRREAGLELTDRIRLTLPQSDADLLQHEQWIKDEVLAVLPHGTGTVNVVEGGLEVTNDEGTNKTVVANAAAVVRLDIPERR